MEEKAGRVKAEKWTKNIAVASILISLLSTIGTCLFNYLTYTKERDVVIKNILTNDQPIKIDVIDEKINHFNSIDTKKMIQSLDSEEK